MGCLSLSYCRRREFLLQADRPNNQGNMAKACQQRSMHQGLCVGSNVQIGVCSKFKCKSPLNLGERTSELSLGASGCCVLQGVAS